jgi:hypothetical protein
MEVTLAPTRDAAVKEVLSRVEYATMGVELLAVAIIVVAILSTTVSYLSQIALRQADRGTYNDYWHKAVLPCS